MATATFYSAVSVSLDGNKVELGSAGTPVSLALASTSLKHDATYAVAATAKRVLLNVGSGVTTDDIASFLAVVILSTQNALVEITGTTAADNSVFPVLANVPLVLGGSASGTWTYNAAGDFAGAAAQNITKINYKNTSANPAVVRILALA